MRQWLNLGHRYLWVLGLFGALAYLGLDSWVRLRGIQTLTAAQVASTAGLAPDPKSPTGYAFGERNLVLPYIGMDGFHWIMQTQQMFADGDARVRHVDYDNPPDGREVHWSSSFRWWLGGLAWLDHKITGEPLPIAVEKVAPFANTLLLVLFMLGLVPVAARRFGPATATLLAIGMVMLKPFYETFVMGNPDHHGLAAVCGLMTILFLIGGGAGWLRGEVPAGKTKSPTLPLAAWLPDRVQARRWFIASGIAGGIGLWISAATQATVLIGAGLGALVATGWLARGSKPQEPWRVDATLWRVWGAAGAATSLFFYFLEYFPSHFGWRLEVNHPLFALAWLGAGDLLCRVSLWLRGEKPAKTSREWIMAGLAVVALVILPLVVYFRPAQTFWVSDKFLWDFHEDYIAEFKGLLRHFKGVPFFIVIREINVAPLLTLPMVWLLSSARVARPAKALLALALVPALCSLALACQQMRWLGLTYGIWLAALVALVTVCLLEPSLIQRTGAKVTAGIFLAVMMLLAPVYSAYGWIHNGWVQPTEWEEIVDIVTRDVAQKLRGRLGSEPGIAVSGPTTTTWLIYYGGFRGPGTLYWENLAGLKTTAAIYSADSPEKALELIKKYGVTHLVIFSWDPFAREYARLAHGLRANQNPPGEAFILQLLQPGQTPPPWLRELAYTIPNTGGMKDQWVRIFEVVPPQTTEDARTHQAQYDMATGNAQGALNNLQAALQARADYLPALITLGRLYRNLGHAQEADVAMQHIRAGLITNPKLALDDRLDLAMLAANTGDGGLVREQVAAALAEADEHGLRRLSVEELFLFVKASQALGLTATRPDMVALANSLLPAGAQEQIRKDLAASQNAAGAAAVPAGR